MRRMVLALLVCACGTSSGSTFDAGGRPPPTPTPPDAEPGADDELDASLPIGVSCTPGSVRTIASPLLLDAPRIDDGNVFWLEPEADADATQQGYWWGGVPAVHRADKFGGGATRLFTTNSSYLGTAMFAVDASFAYWIQAVQGSAFGSIVRGAKDGSSQSTLVQGIERPMMLELANQELFFVSGSALVSIDTDGTNERVVASVAKSISEYVIGETAVYAIIDHQPMRVARTGGTFESLLLAPDPHLRYAGLSVGDDGYVYVVQLYEPFIGEVTSARVAKVPTEGGSPTWVTAPFEHTGVSELPDYFTFARGSCVVFSGVLGVFAECADSKIQTLQPSTLAARFVADSTSVYWHANEPNEGVFAWCAP